MKLDLIGITVADMAESIRFYRLLGWEIQDPAPGEDHHEALLTNGLRVAWDTVELMKQIDPHWQAPVGHRMGLAFLCDSPADVDERFARILSEGFEGHKEPWDAFWGQRYAQVMDPDGNVIDLFAPLGVPA
jgi:catechol 2,3-dioxygenase-like lactoylglutathione lyase family enzyme